MTIESQASLVETFQGKPRVFGYYEEADSAISKPVKPEDVVGERGEEELGVLPKVKIEGSEEELTTVIPQSAGLAHVILAVEDDGEPSLTSYRRVILKIGN
jgi:hypothetical protein